MTTLHLFEGKFKVKSFLYIKGFFVQRNNIKIKLVGVPKLKPVNILATHLFDRQIQGEERPKTAR
jgi:hypothetical protein